MRLNAQEKIDTPSNRHRFHNVSTAFDRDQEPFMYMDESSLHQTIQPEDSKRIQQDLAKLKWAKKKFEDPSRD